MKMKQLRQEKDREVKRVQADADKKERERALQEQKKIGLLEQKVHRSYHAPAQPNCETVKYTENCNVNIAQCTRSMYMYDTVSLTTSRCSRRRSGSCSTPQHLAARPNWRQPLHMPLVAQYFSFVYLSMSVKINVNLFPMIPCGDVTKSAAATHATLC